MTNGIGKHEKKPAPPKKRKSASRTKKHTARSPAADTRRRAPKPAGE